MDISASCNAIPLSTHSKRVGGFGWPIMTLHRQCVDCRPHAVLLLLLRLLFSLILLSGKKTFKRFQYYPISHKVAFIGFFYDLIFLSFLPFVCFPSNVWTKKKTQLSVLFRSQFVCSESHCDSQLKSNLVDQTTISSDIFLFSLTRLLSLSSIVTTGFCHLLSALLSSPPCTTSSFPFMSFSSCPLVRFDSLKFLFVIFVVVFVFIRNFLFVQHFHCSYSTFFRPILVVKFVCFPSIVSSGVAVTWFAITSGRVVSYASSYTTAFPVHHMVDILRWMVFFFIYSYVSLFLHCFLLSWCGGFSGHEKSVIKGISFF